MYRVNNGASGWPEQFLAYYHVPSVDFPEEINQPEEQVVYLNENTPLIFIPATLDGAWYRSLSCPMLVWDREGLCHGVFPNRFGRACYLSEESGRRISITRKNCGGFRREGYAVQRDLPGEAPSLRAVLGRLWSGMGLFETALLLLWSVLGGGLLFLLGELLHAMLNNMILGLDESNTWSLAAGLAGVLLVGFCLLRVGERMIRRISRRAALSLLPALGEQIWLASGPDAAAERAGHLAGLREDGELLARWALAPLCGIGAGVIPAAALAADCPWLVWTAGSVAAGLLLAAVIAAGWSTRHEADAWTNERYWWLETRTSDKRFGVERAFPFGQESAGPARTGLLWLVLPLLMSPVLLTAEGEGLSLAELVRVAVLYLPAVVFPLSMLGSAARVGRALAELRALLGQAGRTSGHDRELPSLGSSLELKNVTFTYPGRREPVLRDVNLRVFPGEVLGVAGGTGAGKTTLARLMAGVLTPDMGQVYYGGIELGRYERESVLRRIAFERGEDIRLLNRAPEELDGRTTVIFSTREEELTQCERIFDLSEGRLTLRAQREHHRNE